MRRPGFKAQSHTHTHKPRVQILQRKIDKSTTFIGDFNTSVSEMDRSSRQKTTKNIAELKSTINELDRIDM
jgi:hypothetical protein